MHETKRALLNFFQTKYMTNVAFKEKLMSLAEVVETNRGEVSNNPTLMNLELNLIREGVTINLES